MNQSYAFLPLIKKVLINLDLLDRAFLTLVGQSELNELASIGLSSLSQVDSGGVSPCFLHGNVDISLFQAISVDIWHPLRLVEL